MATKCAFPSPLNAEHKAALEKCLNDAITHHQHSGGGIDVNGIIHYVRSVFTLYSRLDIRTPKLFSDRSTFRSELKKMSKSYVDTHYHNNLFLPEFTPGQLEYIVIIQTNIKRLLTGEFYRESGVRFHIIDVPSH
jgi:hypothetical protein